MKKFGTLNADISRVLSYMGHTDKICICDCGLPIPEGVELIDISLKLGTPSFLEVLEELIQNMVIEKVFLAEEIKLSNESVFKSVDALLKNSEKTFFSHEDFKTKTKECRAIIRTGENTPYSNIILQSGCIF